MGVAAPALCAMLACSDSSEEAPEAGADGPVEGPKALMLTWQQDPTTTMTIDWHTPIENAANATVHVARAENGGWATARADSRPFELYDRTIHRAEIEGLEPGTTYRFRVGDYRRVYRFRTMPADIDDDSIVFAKGGDTQHVPAMLHQTNLTAMEYDLDFVVWGGDLAYADAGESFVHRLNWLRWFETNKETLIDDESRVVPIVVAIGNHEVIDGYYGEHADAEPARAWRERVAPYFFRFFAFPGQPGYGVLDFGDYLTLIALDSGHTNPVEGAQATWLDGVLAERRGRDVTHILPFYHVAAFPSHRDFDGALQAQIRDSWVPLFEAYDLPLVFENHDHTYKRTHPIRDLEVADDGVVYMGDGAWGVGTREGAARNAWYIDEFASERHAIIVTLRGDDLRTKVVSDGGDILDEFP